MEESERDSGEVSPDRPLPEDEDIKENAPEEQAELFHETDNNSRKNGNTSPQGINSTKQWTTTLDSTIRNIHKFHHIYWNYSSEDKAPEPDIIHHLMELLKRWPLVDYYLNHGAATVWILRYDLNLKKTWAYKQHKLLEISGFVEPKTTITPVGRMKKPATIWGLPEATEAQVRGAYQYHLNLTSPIYRKAGKIAKRYIQEGKPATTNIGELVSYLKDINEPPRMRQDLARMMMYTFSREARAHALTDQSRSEENLRRVLEIIRPPITQSSTLYDVLDLLEINDPDERAAIKDYFARAQEAYESQNVVGKRWPQKDHPPMDVKKVSELTEKGFQTDGNPRDPPPYSVVKRRPRADG